MTGIATKARYDEYVAYLESKGWRREQITLDELNTNIVTTQAVTAGDTNWCIDVRAPAGQKITIMGTQQIGAGADARTAHALRMRLADSMDGNEIQFRTKIRMTKEKSSEAVVQLARVYYADVNLTKMQSTVDATGTMYKTDLEWYRFKQGIELNGEQRLRVYTVTPNTAIATAGVSFALDCDLWTREE